MANKLADWLSPKTLALSGSLTVIYFVAGVWGRRVVFVLPSVTPIWIPAGIALAVFVLFGYRMWPAIFVGSLLNHAARSSFAEISFIIPLGTTLEGLAGAYL